MPGNNSYNYSNYNQFGIKNSVERYLYAGWFGFVFMCSLLGDSTILVASIKYKAFNLHKIVVAFIQHIAVCDLINALVSILPTAISTIYNRGPSSLALNQIRFCIYSFVNTLSASLIAATSLGKLLLLKYPLRTASWSKRQAHKICAGLWTAALCSTALFFLVDKDDVTFDYRIYGSSYEFSSSIWTWLLPIMAIIILFLPNCIIIASTCLLLNEARKVVRRTEESLRWQGIMTITLTATSYCVSYVPAFVFFVAEPFVEEKPVPGPFFTDFYRVAICAGGINIIGNFLVYSLTVTSFRRFLKLKFHQTTSFLSSSFTQAGNFPQKCLHIVQL